MHMFVDFARQPFITFRILFGKFFFREFIFDYPGGEDIKICFTFSLGLRTSVGRNDDFLLLQRNRNMRKIYMFLE